MSKAPAPAPAPVDRRPILAAVLVGVVLLSALRAALPDWGPAPNRVRDEPPERTILFEVTPAGVPGSYVSLVDPEGAQWSVAPNEVHRLRVAGNVRWAVHVPRHKSKVGVVEVPADGAVAEIRITVALDAE